MTQPTPSARGGRLRALIALMGALAMAAALVSTTGCRGNKSKDPPIHPNWNMDDMQYYQAQEDNPWFADRRAMRLPVAGTVARGQLRADDHLYRGRGADGRLVDALPEGIVLDEALLDRGEARYAIFCAICHEASGEGDGIVIQRGFAVPPPNLGEDRLQAMPLGYIYDVITNGRGTMKPYAAQINVHDRWAIAAWVRVLQVSQRAAAADVPPEVRQQLEQPGGTP